MTANNKTVKIFMLPQQFPCGPQSTCCGPIGQTEEEIESLKTAIENELDLKTEVINVGNENELKNYPHIVRLLQAFGAMALPILTLDDEVVSMGNPMPKEAVLAIKEKQS